MAKVTINLDKFKCLDRHEIKGGGDDLYIKYKVNGESRDHRYPSGSTCGVTDLQEGKSWDLDLPIDFVDSLVVSLYDQDTGMTGNYDDFLGDATFRPGDDLSNPRIIEGDGGKYELHCSWA